ncbi:hypothetical protein ILUMI_24784 [Ignelater luminosus]|uniref:Major facilitator superfamily (MFS) profile domain-containing protein n=1 Tax=Ignelater luminosus TaxID=2038154 RepID=A0A8K0G0B0_IGNLU|nr:hypothetical protein ILUMI_24784 [Ignelater luminosus]
MPNLRKHRTKYQSIVLTAKDDPNNDIVQKSIGVMGRWHIWVCFVIFLVKFPVAWHQLSIVFVAPPITFTCADNSTDKCSANCSSHVFNRSVFTETIATQWDLVCEKTQLANFAQTVTMLGILFGNLLFGILSDKFGRRIPLVIAVVIQVVSGTAAAFSPWFWLFLVLRFICASATGGTMVTSFVLVMELIGTKWRTALGILYQIPFNLGHLTLALMGYFLRDWRYFQLAISIPSVILIAYYWVLPESPRWLLAVGKSEEAIKVMENAAHHNGLSTASIKNDVNTYMQKQEASQQQAGKLFDLVRTPNMRSKTFCVSFNWIVCGLCFFGVAQFIGQLGGNIFVNVAFSAVIQIPGTFFSIWSMKSLGRRYTLMGANLIAGCSCLLIALVPAHPTWPKAALGCFGMFGLSVSFPTVYIFSGELYPTVIRNIGVGTSSMCARIGSMLAPFVAGLAGYEPWIPPVIFGIVPLIGAILCLRLPETLDCKLPETLQDAEMFGKKIKAHSNGTAAKVDETEMS